MTKRLARFYQFDPPYFDGDCTEPWVVEGDAHAWWRRMRQTRGLVALQMRWDEFCGLLYGAHFPNSMKQKLKEDLKKLRQGEQSVQEYTREFTRLLNCVPFVARDEAYKVYLFERGLRQEIFVLVQAQRLPFFSALDERITEVRHI
uniref:Retrotransposon gag domain-containing protein n=1 Tax=Ananas comosus var. bracteatus TaxID=296719 RepID=A0A6V7QLW5_ANACO|nr:unnamed protein product [Ananas comosus var. bracteatus]